MKEEIEILDGIFFRHLITKKHEPKKRRIFFELHNNTDTQTNAGNLYLDFRTILGLKIKLINVETEEIKPRERYIFYLDVDQYIAKFKKIGWFLKCVDIELYGICKNSGKEEDLVAYGKKINDLRKKQVR